MHNPLALLSPELLDALIMAGHLYFVRQSYPRGNNPMESGVKEVFLITPYKEFTKVNGHFQAIKFDVRKYIYYVDEVSELKKLRFAASQPGGYKVYVSLLRDTTWKAPRMLRLKIKNYLRTFMKWKSEAGEGVRVTLFIQFGELFLTLHYRSEELKIPLSDIENM